MQGLHFGAEKKLRKRAGDQCATTRADRALTLGPFELNRVHLKDCVEAMASLPAASVDVAIADPPYNLSKGGNWQWDNSVQLPGFGGDWRKVMAQWDDLPLGEYFSFTLSWLSALKRLVKPTGSLWIHGTYHNIGVINFALQLLEIEIINEVVWYKRNGFPNLSGRRLTASHETVLWAHTGGAKSRKYYFAYDQSKDMACPEDLLKEQGKQMRTVWDIPNNKGRHEIQFGKHPTQKPVRLLTRMLALSARANDVVLAPFAGGGSECVAAQALGMRYLAFETDPQYVDICARRLNNQPNRQAAALAGKITSNKSKGMNKARTTKSIPSLIKWTGSKRSQGNAIAALMPTYRRYFEPFLGGGAMLYLAGTPGSIAGDVYEPLIQLWNLIQNDPELVIADYERKWTDLNDELNGLVQRDGERGEGLPAFYYEVRRRFNATRHPCDLNFLMRTCVNGIVRFNDDGEFNNSFHLSRRGMTPRRFAHIAKSWHSRIQGVSFVIQDYAETVASADKDDFVYFDPPYAGNRQRYVSDLDMNRFFSTLEDLNRRGVRWALSFDGSRGSTDLSYAMPQALFKRHLLLSSGDSAVNKVLNGPVEKVQESLYLNY